MGYVVLAVEIIASIVALIAIFLNSLSIYLVLSLRKKGTLSTGLGLILLVCSYDLIGPSAGVIQEIIIKINQNNFLTNKDLCQCVGIIQSLVPFISSGAVALLSIERYLFIFQIIIPKKHMFALILSHFGFGLLLSSLASIGNNYELTTSRMICMVTPNSSTFGLIWYYSIIVFLSIHTITIIFCYSKIISLRRVLSSSVQIPIDMVATNQTKSKSQDFITNHFNQIRDSTSSKEIGENNDNTILKYIKYKPDRFVIKAIILMVSYLICVLPGLSVLIYHTIKVNILNDITPLNPSLSAAMFLPLFSISLINPILLISLHSKVSDRLYEVINHLLPSRFKV